MSDSRTGQVAATAAEIYDQFFVPALFAEWAPRLCDAAMIGEGQSVLDVGCGTGIAARTAAARVGPAGRVTGLDRNEGMLDVARRHEPSIRWEYGTAEHLPFADDTFDATLSQFALMFFADADAALAEMRRVTRPGGQVAVAVWCSLEDTPGYQAMAELLRRLFGDDAAEALRVPYAMGARDQLEERFRRSGFDPTATTMAGTARFPSIEAWVHTDIRGWTLADVIDDESYARLLEAALVELTPFTAPDGAVSFDHPAHLVTATVR